VRRHNNMNVKQESKNRKISSWSELLLPFIDVLPPSIRGVSELLYHHSNRRYGTARCNTIPKHSSIQYNIIFSLKSSYGQSAYPPPVRPHHAHVVHFRFGAHVFWNWSEGTSSGMVPRPSWNGDVWSSFMILYEMVCFVAWSRLTFSFRGGLL